MKKEIWILDTDIGSDVDDAFALTVLAKHPSSKLAAVITTYGPVFDRAQKALELLEKLEKPTIPVFCGMKHPLTPGISLWTTGHEQTSNPKRQIAGNHYTLLKWIAAFKNTCTLRIICTGPATTTAWLLSKRTVQKCLKQVIFLGGTISGKGLPKTEHNISADPIASQLLFSSGSLLSLVSLASTMPHSALPTTTMALGKNGPAGKLLSKWTIEWLEYTLAFPKRNLFRNKIFFHDAIAAMALLEPTRVHFKKIFCSISPRGLISFSKKTNTLYLCDSIHTDVIKNIVQTISSV